MVLWDCSFGRLVSHTLGLRSFVHLVDESYSKTSFKWFSGARKWTKLRRSSSRLTTGSGTVSHCASCSQRQAIGTGFNCDESRGATSASCPWTPREEDEEEMEEVNTSRASCSPSITAAWWFHLKWKTTESLGGLSVVERIFPLGYQRVEFSHEKQCGLAGPETRP